MRHILLIASIVLTTAAVVRWLLARTKKETAP